jgi:hypothetical protein
MKGRPSWMRLGVVGSGDSRTFCPCVIGLSKVGKVPGWSSGHPLSSQAVEGLGDRRKSIMKNL